MVYHVNLELDHVFILVEPAAKVADLLVSLGMEESFSRDHQGQGTSNRRFEFSNGVLEFLWVRDVDEALNGPGCDLALPQRADNSDASPFGLILSRKDNSTLEMPFPGWRYQPDYFPAPMAFHVGVNSGNLLEPLCIYVPFMEPKTRESEKGTFKSLSQMQIYTATDELSDVLTVAGQSDRLSVACGDQHLMEITLDENARGLSKDFRPDIPLIIHW